MEIKFVPGWYWGNVDGEGWPVLFDGEIFNIVGKDSSQVKSLKIAGKLNDFPCPHYCTCTQNPNGTWNISC